MFELVFLGTSAAAPSIYRGLPAVAVLAGEERFLVDCGEGTQRQILRSGVGFKRLNHIMLTHGHLDHILGLGGLVSTFGHWESFEELHFWGSRETLGRVNKLIFEVVFPGGNPPVPVYMHEIQSPGVIHEHKKFTVSAFRVQHRGRGCLGYIFQERDRRPFLANKAAELHVPVGPERSHLVAGESITLDDGTVIEPDMVLGETIPGMKIVFTGDVARTDLLEEHVQDADVLVSEGTFLHEDVAIARQVGHITIKEAADLAKKCNVRNLLVMHVSRRYREGAMIAEARNAFADSWVVRDLDHFVVKRGERLKKVDRDTHPE
ncbi:MAG: MBL fold metallo-hydrolase [Aggregatilineales bacterium]